MKEEGNGRNRGLLALCPLRLRGLAGGFLISTQPSGGVLGVFAGLILGAGIAYGCIESVQPPPPKRTTPYDPPFKTCRPPYVEAS